MSTVELADANFLVFMQALALTFECIAFTFLAMGAGLWTYLQWLKLKNIRDTVRKQKILDDINLKISEDNRRADAKKIAADIPLSPMPANVTPITVKRGEGIWEPNKR